ncbi:MAG TPA: hypothetical protein EYN66_07315 [Myxococcales bacterium]|nr:hypothetical protein [Myxococcales bacterium]
MTNGEACSLRPIPYCCLTPQDFPSPNIECLLPNCNLDPNPPAHLKSSNPSYWELSIQKNCCSDFPNLVAMNAGFDEQYLPQGWDVLDQNAGDDVDWKVLENSDECFSNNNCVRLGDDCGSYYNGTKENCVPVEEGVDVQAATAININLRTDVLDLSYPDGSVEGAPWALTFRLKMNTEEPFEDGNGDIYSGDNLTIYVISDAGESLVFDSVNFGNSTFNQANGQVGWKLISLNLGEWSDKTVAVEFRFDTGSGALNYESPAGEKYIGVLLDNVRVQSLCESGTQPCGNKAECLSSGACSVASCAVFHDVLPAGNSQGFCFQEALADCEACTVSADCTTPPGDPADFEATCVGGKCQYASTVCDSTTLLNHDFEGADLDESWTPLNDPFCSNFWSLTSNRASTGQQSLYFGDATHACDGAAPECTGVSDNTLCPTYDCQGLKSYTTLDIPSVALPSEANVVTLLNFDLFLSTEFDNLNLDQNYLDSCAQFPDFACADRLQLYAIYNTPGGGVSETVIWDSYDMAGSTKCGWQPINVDISSLNGQDVAFRFVFDTQDGTSNEYEGVYVDNLRVDKFCPGEEVCAGAGDCALASECKPASCVQGKCEYETVAGCCEGDIDCDDGNPCTVNTCLDKTCTTAISEDQGCCYAGVAYWSENFEGSGLPENWSIQGDEGNSAPDVKWQWTADMGTVGGGGLYFGNSATNSYKAGIIPVAGSIDTPVLQVPPGGDPILRFDLFLSTEFDGYSDGDFSDYEKEAGFVLDRLSVWASIDGGANFSAVPIWESESGQPLKGSTKNPDGLVVWQDMAFSLKSVAGKSVVLRFTFDSITGIDNDYMGVKIDNMQIAQACVSAVSTDPCYSTLWCEDGDGCTIDACGNDGLCSQENAYGKEGCCFAEPLMNYGCNDTTAEAEGWVITGQAGSPAQFECSASKPGGSGGSLHFGNSADGSYSGCTCGEVNACDGDCLISECFPSEFGSGPAGTAKTAAFTVKKGVDYEISFDLFADLNVAEGSIGALEEFTVRLMTDVLGQDTELATLVCHAGKCDVGQTANPGVTDPCTSGVNFQYPGCGSATDPVNGDYKKWKKYSFKLSEILCGLEASVPQTFINSLFNGASGENQFKLQVDFHANDHFGNCDQGLYLDELVFAQLCDEWPSQCK